MMLADCPPNGCELCKPELHPQRRLCLVPSHCELCAAPLNGPPTAHWIDSRDGCPIAYGCHSGGTPPPSPCTHPLRVCYDCSERYVNEKNREAGRPYNPRYVTTLVATVPQEQAAEMASR